MEHRNRYCTHHSTICIQSRREKLLITYLTLIICWVPRGGYILAAIPSQYHITIYQIICIKCKKGYNAIIRCELFKFEVSKKTFLYQDSRTYCVLFQIILCQSRSYFSVVTIMYIIPSARTRNVSVLKKTTKK